MCNTLACLTGHQRDKCVAFLGFFFLIKESVRRMFLYIWYLGKHAIGELFPHKLNDSVISVICLKARSITQACRTADEQHFYIAHNSTALLFIASICPRVSTDPTFQSAACLNCLENYHLCQGLSFVLIYSVLTLRWLFPRPKVPSWRKCVLIAEVLALCFIVSALWLLRNAAKKKKKKERKISTASLWTEKDHFNISNVLNTCNVALKIVTPQVFFSLFLFFWFLGAELSPNLQKSDATGILPTFESCLTWYSQRISLIY